MKENDERYNPLEVAKAEGKQFAKGIRGTYRENKITLFCYFVFGLLCVALGAFLLWSEWNNINFDWSDRISRQIFIGSLGLFATGIVFMKYIFTRRN